jgi:signal transduction histidine kinase
VQLQQVILNMLRNAIDAMKGCHGRPKTLRVRTERDSRNQICLSIEDNGTGLDAEHLNKLFEAFYTTKAEGMGMGLSVSRTIIERHRGRIWASPNESFGATFSFSIPCDQGAVAIAQ